MSGPRGHHERQCAKCDTLLEVTFDRIGRTIVSCPGCARIAAGRCLECPARRLPNRWRCGSCWRRRKRASDRRVDKAVLRPRDARRHRARRHAQKPALAVHYARWTAGRCRDCPRPRLPNRARCGECHLEAKRRSARNSWRNVQGLDPSRYRKPRTLTPEHAT